MSRDMLEMLCVIEWSGIEVDDCGVDRVRAYGLVMTDSLVACEFVCCGLSVNTFCISTSGWVIKAAMERDDVVDDDVIARFREYGLVMADGRLALELTGNCGMREGNSLLLLMSGVAANVAEVLREGGSFVMVVGPRRATEEPVLTCVEGRVEKFSLFSYVKSEIVICINTNFFS